MSRPRKRARAAGHEGAADGEHAAGDFQLRYVIHAHGTSAEDTLSPVWSCAFAPPPLEHVCATAGADAVCLLDCHEGTVTHKYRSVTIKEEFFCLAWTRMPPDEHPILAAGGSSGTVRLLHTGLSVCFHYFRVCSSGAVHSIAFSPTQPRVLMAGCSDKSVSLWDIGAPRGDSEGAYTTQSACLARFKGHTSCVNAVALSPSGSLALTGANDCTMYAWDVARALRDSGFSADGDGKPSEGARTYRPSKTFPSSDFHPSVVDAVAFAGPTDDVVVSKGACDGDILLWDRTRIHARSLREMRRLHPEMPPSDVRRRYDQQHVLATLAWRSTDEFFVKFAVSPGVDAGRGPLLVAGDPHGDVHLYDLGAVRAEDDDDKETPEASVTANATLTHPRSSRIIRQVAVNSRRDCIVATSDGNAVFVWWRPVSASPATVA